MAGLLDLECEGGFAVDGTANRLVAFALFDGHALARQHSLVERGVAFDDEAVGRHLFAGLDEYAVAPPQFGDRHVFDASILSKSVRLGGHESHELLQSRRGTHHRAHLDPMSEQHDVDQGCDLPEKHLTGQTENDQGAVTVGDADSERNQRHHSGPLLLQLPEETREKRPAAVRVDRACKAELDERVTREIQCLLDAERSLNHLSQTQHWERQG